MFWDTETYLLYMEEGGSVTVPVPKKRVIRLIVIIIEESPAYQLPTKFYPTFFWTG
jgi:hypothetical protein